jgi:signal transduction histidine kinase
VADPELASAVISASMGQVERQLTLSAPTSDLDCRVIPGLEGDDAFVFVGSGDEPDAGLGMDTLMQAIRGDLRDPLRAARAALDLARQTDPGQGDELVFEALLDRVDGLLQVADKLVDLATLWDGQSLVADDRVELWPLLQQVWGEVEPLALGRQVRVRFTTDVDGRELAALYGSARWIRRVFVECLQGAVRLAPRGGEIEVEHLQDGPRASIVLRDCALFAEGSRGADAVSRKLCRHVLALHGGSLREELDGRSRHLVIELPTGAPHRSDQSQLAIAQAQHYARDLAELMNRARRPGRAASADAL